MEGNFWDSLIVCMLPKDYFTRGCGVGLPDAIPLVRFLREDTVLLRLLLFLDEAPPIVFYLLYDPELLFSLTPLKGEKAVPVILN